MCYMMCVLSLLFNDKSSRILKSWMVTLCILLEIVDIQNIKDIQEAADKWILASFDANEDWLMIKFL